MAIVAAIDQDEKAQQVMSEAWKLANQFDEPLHALFVYDNKQFSSLTTENITIVGPTDTNRPLTNLIDSSLGSMCCPFHGRSRRQPQTSLWSSATADFALTTCTTYMSGQQHGPNNCQC